MQKDNFKVLVVDDIEDNIQIVATTLSQRNITVLYAQSGMQAIRIAKKRLPDLILLDINMPELNGYETCSILKKDIETEHIPVIFLSALSEKENIVKGLNHGGVDFISKPFDPEELLLRVFTQLNLKKSTETILKQHNELEIYKNSLEDLVNEKTLKLEKSEKKFRNIFEASNDAIFITDLSGNYIAVNNKKISNSGKSEEVLLESNFIKEYTRNDSNGVDVYFENIKKNGISIFHAEYINHENQEVCVEISGKLIIHDDKESILHISRNITERKQLERKILLTTIETEETERKRFAKDIHDGLGATLSATKMYINTILKTYEGCDSQKEMLEEALVLVDSAIKSAREIAVNIRPQELALVGLKTTLENFIERINKVGTLLINVDTNNFNLRIREDMEVVLFRIISELINNTLKYAEAKNISLKLENSDQKLFSLEYTDDGKGFDFNKVMNSNKSGIGLNNIISRINAIGGKVKFETESGKGLRVYISISQNLIQLK